MLEIRSYQSGILNLTEHIATCRIITESSQHILSENWIELPIDEFILILKCSNRIFIEVFQNLIGYFAVNWLLENSVDVVLRSIAFLAHFICRGWQRQVERIVCVLRVEAFGDGLLDCWLLRLIIESLLLLIQSLNHWLLLLTWESRGWLLPVLKAQRVLLTSRVVSGALNPSIELSTRINRTSESVQLVGPQILLGLLKSWWRYHFFWQCVFGWPCNREGFYILGAQHVLRWCNIDILWSSRLLLISLVSELLGLTNWILEVLDCWDARGTLLVGQGASAGFGARACIEISDSWVLLLFCVMVPHTVIRKIGFDHFSEVRLESGWLLAFTVKSLIWPGSRSRSRLVEDNCAVKILQITILYC